MWSSVFSLHSRARFLIMSRSRGPAGSQLCPLFDPRPTAVCLFCALRGMWGKAADVPKIYRLRHVTVSFCITLTVSVKGNKREKVKINTDRDSFISKRVNCCFLCLLWIFQWLMPTSHSGVLPLVSSVFCKIVTYWNK